MSWVARKLPAAFFHTYNKEQLMLITLVRMNLISTELPALGKQPKLSNSFSFSAQHGLVLKASHGEV